MTKYEYIRDNEKTLRRNYACGFISARIMDYFEIYRYYQKTSGTKMQRYTDTAVRFQVSERTVMNAIKEMEEDY